MLFGTRKVVLDFCFVFCFFLSLSELLFSVYNLLLTAECPVFYKPSRVVTGTFLLPGRMQALCVTHRTHLQCCGYLEALIMEERNSLSSFDLYVDIYNFIHLNFGLCAYCRKTQVVKVWLENVC